MVNYKPTSMIDSLEKIPVKIFSNPNDGSAYVAGELAKVI